MNNNYDFDVSGLIESVKGLVKYKPEKLLKFELGKFYNLGGDKVILFCIKERKHISSIDPPLLFAILDGSASTIWGTRDGWCRKNGSEKIIYIQEWTEEDELMWKSLDIPRTFTQE